MLASTIFALRATANTAMQLTPANFVCGCNSIINQGHNIDWETIRRRKQDLINKANKQKNCNQINHTYKKGDKVSLKNARKTKFNQEAYLGPYIITDVRNNGTVRAHKDKVADTFIIQNLTPYKE